jgi:hypothetical protein
LDAGLSLEELGEAYAQMMQRGRTPYQTSEPEDPDLLPLSVEPIVPGHNPLEEELQETEDCPIAPRSIVEAALFVGHPDNKPLTPELLASVMRGVHPGEIEWMVGYQPGIERKELFDQIGKAAGGVVNQLVRRNLLELRREGKGKGRQERYYPTSRFLAIFQIESLEDLPRVDEFQLS